MKLYYLGPRIDLESMAEDEVRRREIAAVALILQIVFDALRQDGIDALFGVAVLNRRWPDPTPDILPPYPPLGPEQRGFRRYRVEHFVSEAKLREALVQMGHPGATPEFFWIRSLISCRSVQYGFDGQAFLCLHTDDPKPARLTPTSSQLLTSPISSSGPTSWTAWIASTIGNHAMVAANRILIAGAAGAGKTTLAARLGAAHLDVDEFMYLPTEPTFATYRDQGPCATRWACILRCQGDDDATIAVGGLAMGMLMRAALAGGLLLAVTLPPASSARNPSHASRGCATLARSWSQKISAARGTAADIALSRRLAGEAAGLCRSRDAGRRAQGAQVYERALLACDGKSKDPAYQRY